MTTPFSNILQNQFPAGPSRCNTNGGGRSLDNVEMGLQRLQLEEEQGRAAPTTSSILSSSSLMTIEAVLRNKGGPPKASSMSRQTMMSNRKSCSLKSQVIPLPNTVRRRGGANKRNKSRLERWYFKQKAIFGPNDPIVVSVEKTRRDILRKL